jgi:hypothetical protein
MRELREGRLIVSEKGRFIPDAVAVKMIGETIQRCGRFVMETKKTPQIGQIGNLAGLPMRVVKIISYADAAKDFEINEEIWGPYDHRPNDAYFEVEVAD